MASPKPVPPVLVVKLGVKIMGLNSSAMPLPLSAMQTSALPLLR
jgi:hypothetical protein